MISGACLAWQSVGVDDVLDVSVPWSIDQPSPGKTAESRPDGAEAHPVLERHYHTPSGDLRHAVRQTGEDPGRLGGAAARWFRLSKITTSRGSQARVAGPGDVGISPAPVCAGRTTRRAVGLASAWRMSGHSLMNMT